MGGRKDGEGEI